jgi:hypothetical protein
VVDGVETKGLMVETKDLVVDGVETKGLLVETKGLVVPNKDTGDTCNALLRAAWSERHVKTPTARLEPWTPPPHTVTHTAVYVGAKPSRPLLTGIRQDERSVRAN